MANAPQTTAQAGAVTSQPKVAPSPGGTGTNVNMDALKAPATSAPKAKATSKPAAKKAAPAKAAKAKAKPAAKPAAKKAAAKPAAKKDTAKAAAKPKATPTPAVAKKGSNSDLTDAEISKAAEALTENLAGIMNTDAKIEKAKGQADTLRKQAAEALFPIYDRIGLDPDWGKEFTKRAKDNEQFVALNQRIGEKLSKKVRDKVEQTKDGKPIFSQRVKKQLSRLNTSYREGGDGGQTDADKRARDAAKQRSKTNTAKAEMMDHLMIAHKDGDTDKVEGLLKSAVSQWGKALGL